MAGIFRSESMQFVRLTMHNEIAADTVRALGRLAKFHIVDMNGEVPNPTDAFVHYKKRVVALGQWEKRLTQFEDEMRQYGIELPDIEAVDPNVQNEDVVEGVQAFVEPIEAELQRNIDFNERETSAMNELKERMWVLRSMKRNHRALRSEVEDAAAATGRVSPLKQHGNDVELLEKVVNSCGALGADLRRGRTT